MVNEILTQYRLLIIGVFIAIGLLIFRKELNKLIDWIISFKRLSKTKEGYSASTAPESPGTYDTQPSSKDRQSVIKQADVVASERREPDTNWVKPLLAKDYDRACDILREMISREEDPQKKREHRAVLGHVIFEQDKQRGVEYFEDLLKSSDDSTDVYNWYALSLFWDSDYQTAEKVLCAGIQKTAYPRELQNLLALVYHRQGKEIEAIDLLLKTIEQHPRWPSVYQTLAQTLADIGLSDEAVHCCKVGMLSCPQDSDLIGNRVKSLIDLPVVICYIYKSCPDHLG